MGQKKNRLLPEPDREPRAQCAALPWRRDESNTLQVLLISSRETRRWVIPKGWPMKGLSSAQTAAQEAFEEAGVRGAAKAKPAGVYHYDKRLKSGRIQHVRVAVHALKVAEESETWPEQDQRDKLWTTPADAAGLVDEPELKLLIQAFAAKV
jgi:8-oxo-dGTP pyrophosphatase MutT (NUDIX family)